jgi:heterodisulfide reductase subunit B
MNKDPATDISYFPGCSLATTARENNLSLIALCRTIGVNLIELEDWNCCGTSSAHSIDSEIAHDLASRNISLAPPGRPLLIACPGCLLRLREAQFHLLNNEDVRFKYEKKWGRPFDPDLKILHFFDILSDLDLKDFVKNTAQLLTGLKFVPYYGCMLAHPPSLRHEKNYHGLMEKILYNLGAEPLHWSCASRCCGTFLSVARPDIVTPMVDKIVRNARDVGAECIITACAMCHLNLEVRCSLKQVLPILHFSEVISLALGLGDYKDWFSRHLVDPRPLLKSKGLIH